MTFNELASLVASREGKKHQASVGDVREILRVTREILIEQGQDAVEAFVGVKSLAKKKKVAKKGSKKKPARKKRTK